MCSSTTELLFLWWTTPDTLQVRRCRLCHAPWWRVLRGGGQHRSWQVVKQFMTLWLWQGTNKLSRTRALISWDGFAELRPTNLISSRTISHLCFYCLLVPRFKRRCYYCLAVWAKWIGLCFTLSSPTRKREIKSLTLSGY